VGAGGLQLVGKSPFHWGKFSERTIGNFGNYPACSPTLFDILGTKFTAPLNLTSSCTHGYTNLFFKYELFHYSYMVSIADKTFYQYHYLIKGSMGCIATNPAKIIHSPANCIL